MTFDTPAQLCAWYYDHLHVHCGQVRAKGFACQQWLRKRGPWWEQFRNLAANITFTMKGGRTMLRLGAELMDKAGWPYEPKKWPPEPIYANSLALNEVLCKRCRKAPYVELNWLALPEDEAFNAIYWGYIQDGRAAMAYMAQLQDYIEHKGWHGELPLEMFDFQIRDVQSRIQWGWRCAEASYLGALTTHQVGHDRDVLEMQAKRAVLARAKDLTPDRQLCDTCRAKVIET